MKRLISLVSILAALAVSVSVGAAGADSTTYTLQCGTDTFTVTKPNESAAVYTNGTMTFVTAIGAIIGSSPGQNAVLCTINGFGPVPFIITPTH
jgi:hypothetical protein